VRQDDGTMKRTPARTPRSFCDDCAARIERCVGELPSAYGRLGAEIGMMPRRGQVTRSPFGPRLPLREDVDALMRLMACAVRGWEARVRAQVRWTPPAPFPVDSAESVTRAAVTLTRDQNPGVLLALQPGWMTRSFSLHPGRRNPPAVDICTLCGVAGWYEHFQMNTGHPYTTASQPDSLLAELDELAAAGMGECEIVRMGVDFICVMTRLDGTAAGHEILHLHYRARRLLGETKAPRESFDGVPCRQCGDMGSLERAEPPSDPKIAAMHSRCASCGHAMDAKTYGQWAAWYSRWAQTAGPKTCKRCQRGKHDECAWSACSHDGCALTAA